MAKTLEPLTLVPGVRYKGSAVINEFGQIEFRPYRHEEGYKPPQFRTLRGADDEAPFQLLRSKDKVRIVVTADRMQSARQRRDEFYKLFLQALQKLEEYDL